MVHTWPGAGKGRAGPAEATALTRPRPRTTPASPATLAARALAGGALELDAGDAGLLQVDAVGRLSPTSQATSSLRSGCADQPQRLDVLLTHPVQATFSSSPGARYGHSATDGAPSPQLSCTGRPSAAPAPAGLSGPAPPSTPSRATPAPASCTGPSRPRSAPLLVVGDASRVAQRRGLAWG